MPEEANTAPVPQQGKYGKVPTAAVDAANPPNSSDGLRTGAGCATHHACLILPPLSNDSSMN